MNDNITTEHILELLTSSPWDGGEGRKMLFLEKRYYVFDNEHILIDGGIIFYNKTLDKIFIRNEDLRGEVFVTVKEDKVHLKGSAYSKLAGYIHIDTLIKPYDKALTAPLLRVANVEKYLSTTDICKMLLSNIQIDKTFLKNFEENLHAFSAVQSQQIYIRLAQFYFQHFERNVLESICFYFSSYAVHAKLYEEMFMFIMAIQSSYERSQVPEEDLELFIYRIKERLLDAYAWRSPTISTNMINETLLYFKLHSPYLPTPKECVEKLYSPSSKTQREYAFYLALMKDEVKPYEKAIFERLIIFYEMEFYLFQEAFNIGELFQIDPSNEGDRNTLLPLIEALGNCRSSSKEVHLFFIFLTTNRDERVKELAKRALFRCSEYLEITLKQLRPEQSMLKKQIMQLLNIKDLS